MYKAILIVFSLICFGLIVQAQSQDSTTIRFEIDSLIELSDSLKAERLLDEALVIIEQAEEECQSSFGKNDERLITKILIRTGKLHISMANHQKAIQVYSDIISIQESALGKDHHRYGVSLNRLATLYELMGEYDKAEPLFLQSSFILKEALKDDHPTYIASLNNLAQLYSEMGHFDKAESLFLEVISIDERVIGKEHYYYAISLNNLALMYHFQGRYEKAEPLLIECNAVKKENFGKNLNIYANFKNNLGGLYVSMGQFQKAEPLFDESKSIYEEVLGKNHSAYANSLNNLATVYSGLGQLKKAETLHLESKRIRSEVFGKNHPKYANSLNGLGVVYEKMGEYAKAEALYLESKSIRMNELGKNHFKYAGSLNNLAGLYKTLGEHEKAEELFLESISIYNEVFGKNHPKYAKSINNLADLYASMGQFQKAESLYNKAVVLDQNIIVRAKQHLSEEEMNQFILTFKRTQDKVFSLAQRMVDHDDIAGTCFNNALFYKGFLLNATDKMRRLSKTDSSTNHKYTLLKSYSYRLAKSYSIPISEQDSSKIAKLEKLSSQLEKEIARSVPGYSESLKQVNWQEVQAALNPGEAAIEFVHYNYYNPNSTDSTMYGALILRQEDDRPLFISLFEEDELRTLISLNKNRRSDYVNDLYSITNRGASIEEQTRKSMYQLIWAPLTKHLEGYDKIFFSPTGLLHRINLAAIPLTDESSLCDAYNLVQLNSNRQLIIPNQDSLISLDALVIGGVEYEIDSLDINDNESDLSENTLVSRGNNDFIDFDSTLRGGSWNYLKYTEIEAKSISKKMSLAGYNTVLKTGYEALEDVFHDSNKEKLSPRVIHLATHGFFFPDPESESNSGSGKNEPIFKMSDHPMIRSGLILAGGNHVWSGMPKLKGMEDGILTAYEISHMDLSNTELVVLSACETGLGKIDGNEGVYGLQRAFKIAGAKYLIMSLWQVPDRETKDFMVTFYGHLLDDRMTIPEAFRRTQKEMKEKFYNPFQWAGFVLVE